MTIKEVQQMLDAGFPAEWIMKLDAAPALEDVPAQKDLHAKEPIPTPKPVVQPKAEDPSPQPAAQLQIPDFSKQVADMQAAMDGFIKNLQQVNINTSNQPEKPSVTAENILASIIAPTNNK